MRQMGDDDVGLWSVPPCASVTRVAMRVTAVTLDAACDRTPASVLRVLAASKADVVAAAPAAAPAAATTGAGVGDGQQSGVGGGAGAGVGDSGDDDGTAPAAKRKRGRPKALERLEKKLGENAPTEFRSLHLRAAVWVGAGRGSHGSVRLTAGVLGPKALQQHTAVQVYATVRGRVKVRRNCWW